MNKIRTIIVDDEKSARNVLENLLSRNCDNIEVVAKCVDVLSAVEQINALQPELVFLDIQMPNYAGYEIAQFFDEINFKIIFVTAFDQYAMKAFEINAVDYLVKPISRIKLVNAVEKVTERLNSDAVIGKYQTLLKAMQEKELKKIVIPSAGERNILDLISIIAIEAAGSYCTIHLKEAKKIVVSKNLKYFGNILGEEEGFFRSHRTWIINLKHVRSLNKKDLCISLDHSMKAKLSRNQLESFEQLMSLE